MVVLAFVEWLMARWKCEEKQKNKYTQIHTQQYLSHWSIHLSSAQTNNCWDGGFRVYLQVSKYEETQANGTQRREWGQENFFSPG